MRYLCQDNTEYDKAGSYQIIAPGFFRRHKRGTTRRCAFAAKEKESKIKAEWLHILGCHSVFYLSIFLYVLPTIFRQTKNGTYAFDDTATLSLW